MFTIIKLSFSRQALKDLTKHSSNCTLIYTIGAKATDHVWETMAMVEAIHRYQKHDEM